MRRIREDRERRRMTKGLTESKAPSGALLGVPCPVGTCACHGVNSLALPAGKSGANTTIIDRASSLFDVAHPVRETAPPSAATWGIDLVWKACSVVGCD